MSKRRPSRPVVLRVETLEFRAAPSSIPLVAPPMLGLDNFLGSVAGNGSATGTILDVNLGGAGAGTTTGSLVDVNLGGTGTGTITGTGGAIVDVTLGGTGSGSAGTGASVVIGGAGTGGTPGLGVGIDLLGGNGSGTTAGTGITVNLGGTSAGVTLGGGTTSGTGIDVNLGGSGSTPGTGVGVNVGGTGTAAGGTGASVNLGGGGTTSGTGVGVNLGGTTGIGVNLGGTASGTVGTGVGANLGGGTTSGTGVGANLGGTGATAGTGVTPTGSVPGTTGNGSGVGVGNGSTGVTANPGGLAGGNPANASPRVRLNSFGAGLGESPRVHVTNPDGSTRFDFLAYEETFTGGVRTATADINGDGTDDILVVAGQGGGPHVRVFDGVTGNAVANFYAFEQSFHGGCYIAGADLDGDGRAEIVVSAGETGGPAVRVFESRSFGLTQSFYAFDADQRGGARVATGDVNGDGAADIIAAAGAGSAPLVRTFDGRTHGLLQSQLVYDEAFRGGVFAAAADLNGDGRADVITSPGEGGGPNVKVFDGADGRALASYFSGDASRRDGTTVSVGHAARGVSVYVTHGRSATADLVQLDPLTGARM